MALYDFMFENPPSPRTIKRIREAIERGSLRITREHGITNPYWIAYVSALNELIDELKVLEDDLGYDIMEETPFNL